MTNQEQVHPRERVPAASFAGVARVLHSQAGVDETLKAICRTAVATIPACDYAGITVRSGRGTYETRAATHVVVLEVDHLQYALKQGPCVEATRDAKVVVADDLMAEQRWPLLAPRVTEVSGIRNLAAFQLYVGDDSLGALNLYAHSPASLDQGALEAAKTYATHAALAFAQARESSRAEHLAVAVQSNRRIGVAIGILMTQHLVDEEEAFALLRRVSQASNRKLRDVAEQVIHTGELPTDGGSG